MWYMYIVFFAKIAACFACVGEMIVALMKAIKAWCYKLPVW